MKPKTEEQTDFIDLLFQGRCHVCGKPIRRKTKTGREPKYCSGRCRSAAFRARQREKREC